MPKKQKIHTMTVNDRELHTILAALRIRQRELHGTAGNSHFMVVGEFDQIATNGGNVDALGVKDIDILCHRINMTNPPNPWVMARLLKEALSFEFFAFEADEEVSGADTVEWLSRWRQKVKRAAQAMGAEACNIIIPRSGN